MPRMGEKSTCKDCGERIVFNGNCWDHLGALKPRHIAIPIQIGHVYDDDGDDGSDIMFLTTDEDTSPISFDDEE